MVLKFNVTGMTCAACSARVEKVSSQVPGVEKAEVNLLSGTMVVTAGEDVSANVIKAVQQAGYQATLQGEKPKKTEQRTDAHSLLEMKRRIIGSAICLTILMYLSLIHI